MSTFGTAHWSGGIKDGKGADGKPMTTWEVAR